ncbi:methyl-accepting chemotaxis protein [Larsenimonas salina]|uniref:methyl-accepting chemotaxis protein n=1 Tax=Larsenimonas salina TaxID=1295565 RepID=UPI0020749F67|nr:methyl-accepting chemotaxis protein [Larsenimonas salina]MCM5704207.1 nitrate- and nitrite sensing domain-containing protein [Larsenimonas salina]
MSLLHRLPIISKFLLALGLPILAMAFFSISGIHTRWMTIQETDHLVTVTHIAERTGDLVHALQGERNLSAGYLANNRQQFGEALSQQRRQVDTELTRWKDAIGELTGTEDQTIAGPVDAAKTSLNKLDALRSDVDAGGISPPQAADAFTRETTGLIAIIGQVAHLPKDADIAGRISAYYSFLAAKDLTGTERGLVAGALAMNQMPLPQQQMWMQLIGREQAYLETFKALANPSVVAQYNDLMAVPDIAAIRTIRQDIMSKLDVGGFNRSPDTWFGLLATKMDIMKRIENQAVADIMTKVEALRSASITSMWTYVILTAAILLITLALTWVIVQAINRPLLAALKIIKHRGNDLTQRLAVPGSDELSRLYSSFNTASEETERLVGNIKYNAHTVSDASHEIAQGNANLASRTEEQSASLEETAASMTEITETVRHTADNAAQAKKLSEQAERESAAAFDSAESTREAMGRIQDANQQVAAVVSAIDSIAFQTNLLALNASVEASRAGEQGRGFAVVAAEVRQLASRSAEEASRVRTLIKQSTETIEEGNQRVTSTHKALTDIRARIKEVAVLVAEISTAASEQSDGVGQIHQAISQLDDTTQRNAALVEEIAAASKLLDDQAVEMNELIAHYTVSDTLAQDAAHEPHSDAVTPARKASTAARHTDMA